MKTMKSHRGGIRKRGATRTDRDGDMDMDASGARAKRTRPDSTRSALGGRVSGAGAGGRTAGSGSRTQARDKNVDLIQRAITSTESQANIRQSRRNADKSKENLERFSVRGWTNSKASTNKDRGLGDLLAFLERRMNASIKSGPRARITKHKHIENTGTLIVFVRPDLSEKILRVNGNRFSGVQITVAPYTADDALADELAPATATPGSDSKNTADTKSKMQAILNKRYYAANKLLDMSDLANDPDLLEMGIFNTTSTESKFFPALMKVWEMRFDSSAARREMVESASLANNNLNNISVVTTLAQTVPDIKNLDLSNNNFKDAQAMIGWRWKFRSLVFLDLTGNDFSSHPNFKETMLKWYPKLQVLNNVQVRTPEEVALQKKTPIPIQPPFFHDDGQIGEKFVRSFFSAYDNDRNGLVSNVYDNESTFSLNVNTSAPRSMVTETAGWGEYIKKSRNLDKITHLPARMSRSFNGIEQIRSAFEALPPTRHPDITTTADQWIIECYPIPGLADPTGQSVYGVGGLLLTTHGKFEESVGGKIEIRSFDRTFILGPGNTPDGIRVVSDVFCLRAYGGHEAWIPDAPSVPQAAPPVSGAIAAAAPTPIPGVIDAEAHGLTQPGKFGTQLQQEKMVQEMSAKSGMTIQYSEMALSGNGWNVEAAWKNFEELKASGTLPPSAFVAPP